MKGFVGPAFAGRFLQGGIFLPPGWPGPAFPPGPGGRRASGPGRGPTAVRPHPFVWTSAESPEGAASGPAGLAAGATEAGVEEGWERTAEAVRPVPVGPDFGPGPSFAAWPEDC